MTVDTLSSLIKTNEFEEFYSMKVLLAGLEYVCRQNMEDTFTSLGLECIYAHDTKEGWNLFLKDNFRAVIAGARSNGKDVIWLCKKIRSQEKSRHVYILILNESGKSDFASEAFSEGADEVIAHTIKTEELQSRLKTTIRILELEDQREREHSKLTKLVARVESIKEEWLQLLDCISDSVLSIDKNNKVLRCNRAFSKFAKKPYLDLLGQNCFELIKNAGLQIECLSEITNEKEMFNESDGNWYLITCHRAKKKDSSTKSVITIHDITKQKMASEKLKTQQTELKKKNSELEKAYSELKHTQSQLLQQEKMASIGQLAAGVAHEINNPLGFISSNLSSLERYTEKITEYIKIQSDVILKCAESSDGQGKSILHEISEKRKDLKIDFLLEDIKPLLEESLDGASRVKKIVGDLKSFSHIDEAELKDTNINAGIESTINIVWNEIKYKANLEKDYGDIPYVRCYPQQLNQVFMNLLINAAQAIEKQGTISVKTWANDENVFITISDTGCGIPPENINRLFEPFFTTKEVGKGTGLGLSMTYDIVKKHGGEIFVSSEVGKGSSFTIQIPLVE